MSILLRAVEVPYCLLNAVRRWLYERGILASKRLPRPVISIGNISAGGAGKTPATIAVARHLAGKGLKVAVLTRGYGRTGGGGVVDSLDAARFGDEPVLIKKHAPEVDVIVGSNRYENGLIINADVYILDDGFQHLQLHRDFDLVIAGGTSLRREWPAALRSADAVVERRIRPVGLEALRGKRLAAFAGLADNGQFFRMLKEEGLDVVATFGFPDHHRYGAGELRTVRASGADVIVTTEKDAVKLDARDIIAVEVEFVFEPEILERIEAAARGR